MTTKFSMGRDINGYNTFSLQFSDESYSMSLAAGVAQTVTTPTDAEHYYVIFGFEPGANVWVANNTTAIIPTGAVTATASQPNPTVRIVKAGDVLSLITNSLTAEVGVSFYAI
jgi:hypothetical protein